MADKKYGYRVTSCENRQLVILRYRVMFCARQFFVVKYPRQLEMSFLKI